MDRRVFLRNSLLGFAAGSWGGNGLLSINKASAQDIPPSQRPRVIVISDIRFNIGDPDDRQSMAHLVMYANEVEIAGIWPDTIDSGSVATRLVLDNYERDYNNSAYNFQQLDYPTPAQLRSKLFTSHSQAIATVKAEAGRADPRPLYILVWGGTHRVPQSLAQLTAQERSKIRLISIGTYLLDNSLTNGDGLRFNHNAWGDARLRTFNNYPDLWWLEMDWSWNGMAFNEDLEISSEAVALNDQLAREAGALGAHIKEVFPRYFRALDTNSLLYVLDPANDLDDPTKGSWAGRYVKPFSERPNYYIGIDGGHQWNYREPVSTWFNAQNVFRARISTCISQRNIWHQAFIQKVQQLYGHTPITNIPTVNAGEDAAIQLPADFITLTGTVSGLGCDVATYRWTQVGGPATVTLNGVTSSQLDIRNLQVAGNYTFRLTVTDVCGAQATDDIQVTVLPPNQGPLANAGPDQTVTDTDNNGVERVFLDGTGSTDGDGKIVSYVWTSDNRTVAMLNTPSSVSVELAVGVHFLTLTVTDDNGATATDTVTITVEPSTSASDSNDDDSGSNNDSGSNDDSGNNTDDSGSNNGGNNDTDDSNNPPEPVTGSLYRAINLNGNALVVDGVAFEGKDAPNYSTFGNPLTSQIVPAPAVNANQRAVIQSFIRRRSSSVTMTSVPDGDYQIYLWVFQINASSFTFSLNVNERTVLTNLASGTTGNWQRLNLGTVSISNGQLVVQSQMPRGVLNICAIEVWRAGNGNNLPPQNQGPIANAGTNQTVTDDNGDGVEPVTLDGTGSSDSDGSITSYVWREGNTTLASTASASVSLTVGVHTLILTVTDNNGATDTDTVTITVNEGASVPEDGNDGGNNDDDTDANPSEPVTGSLYRAINLNGNALVVDGVAFEGKDAPNYSTFGNPLTSQIVPAPAVNANQKAVIQSFIRRRSSSVTMTSVPDGDYQIYLWVFQINASSFTFSLNVNERTVLTNLASGTTGDWQRLNLGTVSISNDQLVVQSQMPRGVLNICAIEVWRS